MTKIKLDTDSLQSITIFEKITKAQVKDFFDDPVQDRLVFIVQPGQLYKALGERGANAKKLQDKFNRKIKIVEFNNDRLTFIKNMLAPLKVKDIHEEGELVVVSGVDMNTNGLMIGRNAQNLRNLETNIRRHFEVKEIRVV